MRGAPGQRLLELCNVRDPELDFEIRRAGFDPDRLDRGIPEPLVREQLAPDPMAGNFQTQGFERRLAWRVVARRPVFWIWKFHVAGWVAKFWMSTGCWQVLQISRAAPPVQIFARIRFLNS